MGTSSNTNGRPYYYRKRWILFFSKKRAPLKKLSPSFLIKLLLQTSAAPYEIAFSIEDTIIERQEILSGREAPDISSAVHTLLQKQKKDWKDLSEIRIINGPGSFTTLRNTSMFAQILSHEQAIPLLGIHLLHLGSIHSKKTTPLYGINSEYVIQATSSEEYIQTSWKTLPQIQKKWIGYIPQHLSFHIPSTWEQKLLDFTELLAITPLSSFKKNPSPEYGSNPRIGKN